MVISPPICPTRGWPGAAVLSAIQPAFLASAISLVLLASIHVFVARAR